MVEETTASVHLLRQEGEELANLVSRFEAGPARESDNRPPRRKESSPPPRPMHKRAPVPARGGALRKPEPVPAADAQEESWEEF
jgi:hypothetical protein